MLNDSFVTLNGRHVRGKVHASALRKINVSAARDAWGLRQGV